tara:strand:- start:3254 stop:4516 length:1263 start_codon:yes stop_codon:yes gene_type:complete
MNEYETKESGFDWLGEVPIEWIISKNRYFFKHKQNEVNKSEDTTVLSLTVQGIKIKENLSFGKSTESYIGHQIVEEGDIVFTPRDFDQTPILSDVSQFRGCISNLYIVDETKNGLINHFLNYFWYGLKYKFNYFKNFSFGMRYSFNRFQFDEIPLLIPPEKEQKQIVLFLDTKTQEVNESIVKIEKRISLLKEQKTSFIYEYLTRGLNQNVKMKSTGVKWMEEVPSHWRLIRLRYLFEIRKRISGELGFDVLSVTQKGLRVKNIKDFKGQHALDYSKYQLVFKGEFVMNHMDLLTGFVGLSEQKGVTSPDYRVFGKINKNIYDLYFLKIFEICYYRKIFYGLGKGVAEKGRWRLPSIEFKNFLLPFPEYEEQKEIVEKIDNKIQLIDDIISKEKRRIELLNEFKKSLIADTVTGKNRVNF